ncbi:TBCC domain-containing protein 1 isoform X2 [Mustelus asterias]
MQDNGFVQVMEQPSVRLWVKYETFIVGVLQIPPPSKFSMHYLRKMATYVRTKGGDGGYPRLSWPMWRHIACGKLQLAEYLAWLYFETFDSLLERTAEERLEWAEAVSHCRSEEEVDKLKNKLSVDTLQFLLFLYVQQLNKVSLRTSLIGEEWPSPRSQSPDLDGKSNSQNKNMDDHNHLVFVLNHLLELLELLLDPEQLTASAHTTHDSMVSVDAVKALNFLIEGSVGQNEVIYPVHELALWQPILATSGYSRLSKMFCFHKLQAWLRSVLGPNPFGTAVCFQKGKKLAWAQQVEGTTKRAKIACNIYSAPKGHKVVVMTQVYKQTLAKSSDQLVGAHVKIHRCNDCYIYLLSPLRSVSIEKCRNTTFVLGPVQTTIHVHSCDDVKVIAICRRLSVSSSSSCTFHCLTSTNPLIMSGNMSLTFAPYHTYYPMLEDHMARTGIATIPNYWNKPLYIGVDNNEMPVYQLLSPKEFYLFVIPFEIEGDTMEIPGGLPPPYEKAVRQREQKIQNWQKTIKEAGLSKEQRKLFQNLVEQEFCEWLDQTGHRQQLDSLIPAPTSSKQTTC